MLWHESATLYCGEKNIEFSKKNNSDDSLELQDQKHF